LGYTEPLKATGQALSQTTLIGGRLQISVGAIATVTALN